MGMGNHHSTDAGLACPLRHLGVAHAAHPCSTTIGAAIDLCVVGIAWLYVRCTLCMRGYNRMMDETVLRDEAGHRLGRPQPPRGPVPQVPLRLAACDPTCGSTLT